MSEVKTIPQIKLETAQNRLEMWRLRKEKARDLRCPICGKAGAFHVVHTGNTIKGMCSRCYVVGEIPAVELTPEEQTLVDRYKIEESKLTALKSSLIVLEDRIRTQEEKLLKIANTLHKKIP